MILDDLDYFHFVPSLLSRRWSSLSRGSCMETSNQRMVRRGEGLARARALIIPIFPYFCIYIFPSSFFFIFRCFFWTVLFTDETHTQVKLIDFGMSKRIRLRAAGKYFQSMSGTLYYTAPEVFSGHYDEACDVWSLGTMLFVMLIGCPIFFGNSEEEVRSLILK